VLPERQTADLAASFQRVAFQHIEDRLDRAMDYVEREYNNNNDNDSDNDNNKSNNNYDNYNNSNNNKRTLEVTT